jgi:hypothetical protein
MLATRPPYLLALAVAVGMLVPPIVKRSEPTGVPTRALTAEDIIAASLDAQGGCARIAQIRDLVTTGRLVAATGETATLTLSNQAPRSLRMVVTWEGNIDYRLDIRDDVVTIDQGIVDGVRDRQVVTGSEREQYLIDASFACHADAQNLYPSSKLLGITDFEGTRAYQIERTTASGLTRVVYIAVDTMLPIGEERDTVTERTSWEEPGPPHLARIRFSLSDYRWVDGVRFAFESRQSVVSGDDFLDENTFYVERVAAQTGPTYYR